MDGGVKYKDFRYVIQALLLFIAYFATAKLGLSINAVSHFATLIWAPTGIATAALLLLGYRYWPSITAAAFLINLATGAKPLVALGIATGNTLEPLVAAYLLNQVIGFQPSMERVKDVLGLVFVAAIPSTAISATVGVSSLYLGHTIPLSAYPPTWLTWWTGDMLGILVVAPLILVWSQQRHIFPRGRIAELAVYLGLLVGMSMLVFRGDSLFGVNPFTLAYLIFPVMIFAALRFGQVGSVTATFATSLVAIGITVSNFHMSGEVLSRQLLLRQSFMGITAVTFMTMAAIAVEREQTKLFQERLAQRAKLLTRQRAHLVALNRTKDEFIMVASHQLRTPATSVKQYTGMLLANYAGRLTKAQRELLETAYASNERQLRIVNMLLNVAQVDAGKVVLKKEKVNLTLLVTDILHSMKESFAAKNQIVNFTSDSAGLFVTVDRGKIEMVLENLIENASKYSAAEQEINIELKRSKHQATLSVKDSGVGIAKKDMSKLFKKFSRIDNPLSISAGGNGLGLYWAKKIILLHQGTISVDSQPGAGSTFIVNLPARKSSRKAMSASRQAVVSR